MFSAAPNIDDARRLQARDFHIRELYTHLERVRDALASDDAETARALCDMALPALEPAEPEDLSADERTRAFG